MKSVFKHTEDETNFNKYYHEGLALFGVPYTALIVPTSYGDTHVLQFGDRTKQPLLLLHGMTMSSTMWYPNVKHLIEERCVYAIDVLGDFGKSNKVLKIINNKRAAADWLFEVVKGLSLQQCDIAGHSMGGFLALNFTLQYKHLINKLILLAPAATFKSLPLTFYFKIFPPVIFHSRKLVDVAFKWISIDYLTIQPSYREQMMVGYTKGLPVIQLVPSVFKDEELQNLPTPTLLLIGEKEVIYPPTIAMERARKLIPNLKSYFIPNANHTFTIEAADVVNAHMLNFLKE